MCGLVGLVIKGNNGGISADVDAFANMLFIDTLRGEDSTGVVLWDKDGEAQVIKDAIPGPEMIKTKEFARLRTAFISRGKALLGHNRKKTVGKIENTTAHPFVYDDRYIFMHNGTLTNDTQLLKDLPDLLDMGVKEYTTPKTGVDSEILGQMLVPFGEDKEKLEKQLSKVYGAYACVWLDMKEEKLYLLRNKERPLFLAKTSVGLMYGSEPSFIYAAASRNRIKVEELAEVKEDTLYTIDVTDSYLKSCSVETKELTVKKSQPLVITTGQGQSTKKGGKHVGKEGQGFSKNAFKRFRKELTGKSICFWLDHWVPRSHPSVRIPNDEWVVSGEALMIEDNHVIYGYLDNVDEETIKEAYHQKLVCGVVTSVVWDVTNNKLRIYTGNVKTNDYYKQTKDQYEEAASVVH